MGQVCSREDDVNKDEDDINKDLQGNVKPAEPMRPATGVQQGTSDQGHVHVHTNAHAVAPTQVQVNVQAGAQGQAQTSGQIAKAEPIQEKPKTISSSQIEGISSDARQFEPYTKMHQLHNAVQRRLDTMVPLKADSQPALKAKYPASAAGTQVFRDKKTYATYQGQMNKGVPHGFGRFTTSDGSIIEGFFNEGKPDGFVRRITAPHAATYEGEFKNDQPNGNGRQIDERGIITDCRSWVNGVANGATTMKGPQGQVIFEGFLENGKKNGQCSFYDEKEKATISGVFKNDVLDGKGIKRYDNGQVYEGDFKAGVENGQGSLTFIDGRKFTGPFSNGKANGAGNLTTDTGKTVKQTWKEGKRV